MKKYVNIHSPYGMVKVDEVVVAMVTYGLTHEKIANILEMSVIEVDDVVVSPKAQTLLVFERYRKE